MTEQTRDTLGAAEGRALREEMQRLHGEMSELKAEMNTEFRRLNAGIGHIQTSLPGKAVFDTPEEKAQAYWQRNIILIGQLLAVWALVSYVFGILLATSQLGFIGSLPFSFWWAQQGSIITFIVLIYIYARQMDKLDREFDLHE